MTRAPSHSAKSPIGYVMLDVVCTSAAAIRRYRFKLTSRAARQGRNPATGETLEIPASRQLAFSAANSVRDALNNGASGIAPIAKAKASVAA